MFTLVVSKIRRLAGKVFRSFISKIYTHKSLVDEFQTWNFQNEWFIRFLKICFAVDVGANIGQWGSRFRKIMPDADILSFEPDLRCQESLDKVISQDKKWKVRYLGLGDSNTTKPLNLWDVKGGSTSFRKLTKVGEKFRGGSTPLWARAIFPFAV